MGEKVQSQDRLVMLTHPRSHVAEAYRTLRTNIQFASVDRPVRTLLTTSTGSEEGKSTTSANLAVAMAETGASVILVDCDLRRPSQHLHFGLDNRAGLTTVLIGGEGTDLPLLPTAVPELRLLPSGPLPPNPSEVLGSRRMKELLERLAGQADYVLLDVPPILAVADASILAARVDGVLLVVDAGRTKRDLARRAREALDRVNARVLGVVLHNAETDRSLYGYYGPDTRL